MGMKSSELSPLTVILAMQKVKKRTKKKKILPKWSLCLYSILEPKTVIRSLFKIDDDDFSLERKKLNRIPIQPLPPTIPYSLTYFYPPLKNIRKKLGLLNFSCSKWSAQYYKKDHSMCRIRRHTTT